MDGTHSRFEYDPGVIRHGRGCVQALGEELDRQSCERAVLVCGQTVGAIEAVIEPIREGLGDRLVGIFDETTPDKRLSTAIDGADRMTAVDADALVAVGGGSSLDVAKVISTVAASDTGREQLAAELSQTGTLAPPAGELPPIAAVPTTLAGADLSMLAGITVTPESGLAERPIKGGVSDRRLMPAALFYDAALVETTPRQILAGSAMNGFDKGIETLYAANATPVTDGTALRGLTLLREALPTLTGGPKSWATEQILEGTVLVQYGISRPDETTLSLIHAFGHGLRATAGIQQGVAHAIIAPHALTLLFEKVDGRRELLARALDIDTENLSETAIADTVVGEVETIRDGLGLPTQLRAVEGLARDELGTVARKTKDDSFMDNCPTGFDPTVEELTSALDAAW